MSGVILNGDTSGTVTVQVPAVAGTNTITIPARTGNAMIDGPAFSSTLSSNQTISAGVNTKVQFNTEEFDTNNNYDNATNYRFTPTIAGYYYVTLSIQIGGGQNYLQPMIYKNGSQFRASTFAGSTNSSLVSSLMYFNGTTDYVEAYVYTGSTTISNTTVATYFQGCLARGV